MCASRKSLTMDPKAGKAHSKRVHQDSEQLSSCRPNRLFLSETIPPSIHQQQPQASQNRSHNLSDRIHEYYEKLVKNSQMKNSSPSHPFAASSFQNRFADSYVADCNQVTGPNYRKQVHQSVPISAALQPGISNTRQPYTVFVEDPTGAFERFNKKKPASTSGASYHESSSHQGNLYTPKSTSLQEKSTSTSIENRGQCTLCLSSSHSSQNCTLQSRVPAEHDGFPSETLPSGSSPPTRHSGGENKGDGSEDKDPSTTSTSRKRPIPANINVSCERDVIGQEKSPVSKSHPASSTALSTSSSNGDTVPRERKKWVRPPLVGQAASSSEKSPFMSPAVFDCLDDCSSSSEKRKTTNECLQLSSSTGSDQTESRDTAKRYSHPKSSYFDLSVSATGGLLQNEDLFGNADRDISSSNVGQHLTSEGEQGLSDSCAGGRVSPSSSVTSNRRLEWDSGADVGYNQMYGPTTPDASTSGLCTIERMVLAQGCSVALHLRLDPEGTTVPTSTSALANQGPPVSAQEKAMSCQVGKPTAESTPIEHLPRVANVLRKFRNDNKNVISPIIQGNEREGAAQQLSSAPLHDDEGDAGEKTKSRQKENQGSTSTPLQRQFSNSMQDLRKFSSKQLEDQLLKSQSDPDLSAETLTTQSSQSKLYTGISKGRKITETPLAGQSVSSESDATLVHVGTEEDLAMIEKEDCLLENPLEQVEKLKPVDESPCQASESLNAKGQSALVEHTEDLHGKSLKPSSLHFASDKKDQALLQTKQTNPPSNLHVCSDSDHKRGLHHHFGVLCSTVLGGHIQSSAPPLTGAQTQHQPPCSPTQDSELLTGESTGSSAFHSDAAHEENAPCASTLTGRANSFEYLPGHIYENNPAAGVRKHERPPGISTSTETDSEPVRPVSRVMHRKVIDSSSHDTEDDRLWGSPHMGSNTLVQDLERGLNLLKGVMENKSADRRCKRELVRRIIKKLVTTEYVEDIIEKEKMHHKTRSSYSPRKLKYQERLDRNVRPRRNVAPERQEIPGESDEPKRVYNVRRKIPVHQSAHHSQGPRTLSTLASGSKSSSLWSSNADSTSGSITLSGSSENHKESKTSVKTNPMYDPHQENTADWLKPATQSEKLFEMRKTGTSQAEKHLAGITGLQPQEPVINPLAFKNDPQKQLSWVTKEINHLKILKQLLQKQESLKQSLDPNLCQMNLTTMPVTGLKQTMQMADCTSPDVPEAHSPKLKPSRLHQWISLESDTSAGFGLSNNTASSRDSHWRDVEVACAGEQDNIPHRTVSISDGDQATDASCSFSNRKSDGSHNSGPQMAQKSRRRTVSISDTDQQLGPHSGSDVPIQKKRSDGSRPSHVSTRLPSKNLASDVLPKQVCECCTLQSHSAKSAPSTGPTPSSLPYRGVSSLGQTHLNVRSQLSQGPQSTGPHSQNTGALKKGESGSAHQLVHLNVAEVPSRSTQHLSDGNLISTSNQTDLVKVHIEVDPNQEKSESQKGATSRERVRVADASEASIVLPHSDDSISRAVSEAVSSKVKALKNIGQIEEAVVQIRVKVAPGQQRLEDSDSHSSKGRVLKTQDLEDENYVYSSKPSEMDDVISRQRAMDLETRQKLLAIAENRRAQMGLYDVDRRIQDLLLQDYLSRQLKIPESTSTPHARLNVRVEAPVMQGSSIGVQSEVDKKTIGTSTGAHLDWNTRHVDDQSYTISTQPPQSSPSLGVSTQPTPNVSARQPQFVKSQAQQTQAVTRPQTAPASCLCSCQPQLASSPGTYNESQTFSSPERQIEFELELKKQRKPQPYKLTPFEVHETLKSRNTAYFLQFEEDPSVEVESERAGPIPPMEVVTVKIPKQKKPGAQLSSLKPSAQGGKKTNKGKISAKQSSFRAQAYGKSSSLGTPQSDEKAHTEQGSLSRQSVLESLRNGANLLRTTPGRSHLSVTVSSRESTLSPEEDSRSSHQHPSRRAHRSPRPNKRKEKIQRSEMDKENDACKATVFKGDGNKSPSSAMSDTNFSNEEKDGKLPANDSESLYDFIGDSGNSVPTLQDYLEKNHPKYLDAAEKRRRCIAEMSYLRRLRQQSRKRLLELEGDNMRAKHKQQWRSRCASRPRPVLKKRSTPRSSKSAGARRYMFFQETQQRLAELKKKEEKRTNRLMAEIYTRKLQEKVLKGTATIGSSVSVISSL